MRFIQYSVVRGSSDPNHYGTDTDGSETQDIVTDLRNHFHSSGRKPLAWRIPAKAGIQFSQILSKHLDSGFHRSDDFS